MTSRITEWQKATASDQTGNCVEMRRNGDVIEMRDTKNRQGSTLSLTPAEIAALFDGVRKSEFDHLI